MDERKLLIADDSELNRAILVSVLEKNFDILEAADGKEAIATLAAHEGNIAALQTDMARLSLLQNTITTGVAQEFDNGLIAERVEVSLGSLLPGLIFSGRGPTITVVVQTVGNISAEFNNEFFAQGINQTLHRIVLTVTAELSLLLPGGIYTYTSETRMILAETVLLGQVPDSYGIFGPLDAIKDGYDAPYYDLTTEEE